MANNLVRNSLYKFLNEGLVGVFVTYNSNYADVKSFDNIYSENNLVAGDLTFTALDEDSEPIDFLYTDIDLSGWTVGVNNEVSIIDTYDNSNGNITLTTPLSIDIAEYGGGIGDRIDVYLDKWVYFKSPYTMPISGRICSGIVNSDKYILYVKTKDDNEKIKINNILQNINNIVMENYFKFPVYDSDGITRIADATISSDFYSTEIYDNTSDIQSFMVEFKVSYTTIKK